MSLVDYTSDSSSEESNTPARKKRKVASDLPPLPSGFRDLYATPVRTSKVDDPTLHDGRQRVNPHIDGNWPTHVYTEWNPSEDERQILDQLIKSSSPNDHEVHGLLLSDLGAPAPLHVSLSSSLGLQSDQRDDFAEGLRAKLDQASVYAFLVSAFGLKWVPNFTKTRWFLVLQLDRPRKDELNRLLQASNELANSLGYPSLYIDVDPSRLLTEQSAGLDDGGSVEMDLKLITDSEVDNDKKKIVDPFHVSIAWSLSIPPSTKTADLLGHETSDGWKILSVLEIPVDTVKAKIGNNILTFPLKSVSSTAVPNKSSK